jgi:3-methyladenine DNA glycosylase/8-oxoguanine DNA glycosylase
MEMTDDGAAAADLAGPETVSEARTIGRLALSGAGGEPVDLARTLRSHGVATLPPQQIDPAARTLETTLALGDGQARTIWVRPGGPGDVTVEVVGDRLPPQAASQLLATTRQLLNLDQDLSRFYALAAKDPALDWVAAGAGRMLRSPTVFEDVVKTICTTNCSWSATIRMATRIVADLGDLAPDGRRAFPSPAAMAGAGEEFYRDLARAGYRGRYLLRLAADVANGLLDLEQLRDPALPDAEVSQRLLALPGVGPYAAAHVMLTSLGRYRQLIFDSWTRPTYAQLTGRKATDRGIERRFRRFGDYAGLAFWLFLTRGWVDSEDHGGT